jgi:hypothetical protein
MTLPLIPEVINKLRDANIFTKLDIQWGYNNVRIREGDEYKAAFKTNRGLYEPLVMYFGLCNAPATFQRMMNEILKEEIDTGKVHVYMDDILIATSNRKDHMLMTRRVFQKLMEYKLYLKPEKCEFDKSKVDYLGLVISLNEVAMDPVKVQGIREWPTPINKHELQSFLGFCNFYR